MSADLQKAIAAGKQTWALVLAKRGQTLKLVDGRKARADELVSWTHEGARRWRRVATVKYFTLEELADQEAAT